MNRRMFNRLFPGLTVIVVIGACAKISSPAGGIKDTQPPVVVKSMPVNGAKNFNGNKIEILFDEYVVLDNINDKFLVSPPMKKKPKVLIKGQGVVVEFDEKLKDSTTYTLDFQDAIKDLNEGNILKNYQFVLSTGPVKDSLSVTGNVYNSSNLEIPEKTIVLLYRNLADSAVLKHLPDYITRVDQTGYFRIDNIRPGTYKLYSLKDADNSNSYNHPDEEFAFLDSTVVVTPEKNFIPPPPVVKDTITVKKEKAPKNKAAKDTTNVKNQAAKVPEPVALTGEHKLFQFLASKKAHYLVGSHRDISYQMVYVLSMPPDTMRFDFSIPGTDSKKYFKEPSKNRDTLKVWLTDSTLYSQTQISTIVKYPFTDTLGVIGYKQDTILMRFMTPKAAKATKVRKRVLPLESNIQSGFLKPGQTIVFKAKTPLRQPDTSKIKLYEIVEKSKVKVPYNLVKDSSNSYRYYLKTKLAQEKKYFFIADKGSFRSIYNEYSDSLGIRFSVKDPETYCKLTLDIKNYEGNRIIQLLDKTEKLLAEAYMKKDGKIVFPLLDGGVYRIRVIYDLNGDGKWTTGDFTTHRQPEPVTYFPLEIELKPGWELKDQEWDIGVKNFKDPKLVEKKKGK
jgi:hypothetical protein